MKFVINMEYEFDEELSNINKQTVTQWINRMLDGWQDYFSATGGTGFIGFLPESEDDNETKD